MIRLRAGPVCDCVGNLLLISLLAVTPALAQQSEGVEDIVNQRRQDLSADGIPVGAMRLYPEIGLELRYFDNVFATSVNRSSDSARYLLPSVRLESQSDRHLAEIGFSADIGRFADLDTEDFDDLQLWGSGQAEFRGLVVQARVQLDDLHEARTSPDDIRGVEPTTYDRNFASVGVSYAPARLLLGVRGEFSATEFDPTLTLNGSVGNEDRDRDLYRIALRAGFNVSPDTLIYTEFLVDDIEYSIPVDRDGFRRTSEGEEIRIGADFNLDERVSGGLYFGDLKRRYDDLRFEDSSGSTYGGEVSFLFRGLTTVSISAEKTIDTTTIEGASGIDKSQVGIELEHELRRNALLTLIFQDATDDFEGTNRQDDLRLLQLGGRYAMNRNLQLGAGYRYRERVPSLPLSGGRAYEIDEFFIGFYGQW